MKKIIYIIGILAVLSGLSACRGISDPDIPKEVEDGKIVIDVALDIPSGGNGTKAMSQTAAISNIYVAVFGSKHYLNEFVKAVPLTADDKIATDGSGNLVYNPVDGKYKVRIILTESYSARYVHVLANVDEDNLPHFNQYEDQVMIQALRTTGDQDGYWQYLEFKSGLNSEADPEASFRGLKLIRNFAKINISLAPRVTAMGYVLEGFEVYNNMTGLFPAVRGRDSDNVRYTYSTDFATAEFSDLVGRVALINDNAAMADYLTLLRGLLPQPASGNWYDQVPETFDSGSDPKFIHENILEGDSECAFAVAKISKDGVSHYYRFGIRNADGEHIPIIRNYSYTISITGMGMSGYDTAREAAQHPSNTFAFANLDTSELEHLDNGVSRMDVSYTEKAFTNSMTRTGIDFEYRYWANGESTDWSDATISTPETGSGAVGAAIDPSSMSGWPNGSTTGASSGGWRKVSFNVTDPPASGRNVSTFTVLGVDPDSGSRIRQTVTIISMPLQDFVSPPSSVSKDADDIYRLTVTLPDDLPRSVFPLEILFDQADDKISPARAGTLVEIRGDEIEFFKEVSYEDYVSSKELDFWFVAVKEIVSGDKLKVRDQRSAGKAYLNEIEVEIVP